MKIQSAVLCVLLLGCSSQARSPEQFVPTGESNLKAAQVGYEYGGYQSGHFDHKEWRDISTAPRDGTVIEIMCYYGVAPWWALMKFDGEKWLDAQRPAYSVRDDYSLRWRPHRGSVSEYHDPTNGLLLVPSFERGAEAYQHRLPKAALPYLEENAGERYRQSISSCPAVMDIREVEVSKTVDGDETVVRMVAYNATKDSGICSFWIKDGVVRSVSAY